MYEFNQMKQKNNILPFPSVLQQIARAKQLHKDQLTIHQEEHLTHPQPDKNKQTKQQEKGITGKFFKILNV